MIMIWFFRDTSRYLNKEKDAQAIGLIIKTGQIFVLLLSFSNIKMTILFLK